MSRSDFVVGQKVYFGRQRGEKTLGKIVKLNPTKAVVETLEVRGRDGTAAGKIWTVPYDMLSPASESTQDSPPAVLEALKYSPFDGDNALLAALFEVYIDLSPENLSGDGEIPISQVRQRLSVLRRKVKGLCIALGREVTEDQIAVWDIGRRKYEDEKKARQKA